MPKRKGLVRNANLSGGDYMIDFLIALLAGLVVLALDRIS
jgi:hypothetical protein